VLGDAGRFRAGAQLGEDRAGFSGRHKVMVFANPDLPGWAELEACLRNAAVEAELGVFTPVLVDERSDLETEAGLRARHGLGLVARSLSGKLLGVLPRGFSCADLVALLRHFQVENPVPPEKSPLYARLLESPQPIDDLIQRGERARAEKVVEMLREFEGAASLAVAAAEARLGR
jgi:hypothetical protein